MSTYQWKLIAQTKVLKNLSYEYQLLVYEYTTENVVAREIRISGDFKLKLGTSSPQSKFLFITPTQIDFAVIDENRYLSGRMKGKSDNFFKGVLKRDGVDYFVGNIQGLINSYNFMKTDTLVSLKLYDGLVRLKNFTNLEHLPQGIARISEIVRTALNVLQFNIDINVYMITNSLPAGEYVPDPEGEWGEEIWVGRNYFYNIGVRVKDLLIGKSNPSYWDVLETICKLFVLNLFQENGQWQFRQQLSQTVPIQQKINYLTGGITETSVGLETLLKEDDILYAPEAFSIPAVPKVNFILKPQQMKNILLQSDSNLGWINKGFKFGSSGWTVISENANFLQDSVQLSPAGKVSQICAVSLTPAQTAKIRISATVIRYYKSLFDPLYVHNLFRILFVGDNGAIYYLRQRDNAWVLDEETYFSFTHYQYTKMEPTTYLVEKPGYYALNVNEDLSVFIKTGMPHGKIKVELLGGQASIYNYPFESTQFNYCQVDRDYGYLPPEVPMPDNVIYSAIAINDPGVSRQDIQIPLHDEDPYIAVNLWNMVSGEKTRLWEPGNSSLLEIISSELVKLNCADMECLDVRLQQTSEPRFRALFVSNITGVNKRYMPVYFEFELIANKRRVIMIQHEAQNVLVKFNKEFKSSDDIDGSSNSTFMPSSNVLLKSGDDFISEKEIHFDANSGSGIIYEKGLNDLKLIEIIVAVEEAFDGSGPLLSIVNSDSSTRFPEEEIDLLEPGFYRRYVNKDFLENDNISINLILPSATKGKGRILLMIKKQG